MKMETTSNDQAEDLSERSESNNSCVTTSSNSNSSSCSGASETGFVDSADAYNSRADGPADLSLAQNKDYQRSDVFVESSSTEDPLSGSNLFRSKDTMLNQKESAMYTFCQIRQKSLHVALERSAAAAVAAGSGGKDLEFMKAYGLHGLDRVKDLTFSSRMTGIGLDRLRSGTMHETASSNIDPEDLKTLQQQQQQQQRTHHLDHPMSFERLRHAHPIFQEPGQFSHPQHQVPVHHLSHHHQHAITQLQHPSSQHQQHQHPQAKSFTIDAILGLRGGGAQRDKQRVHPYRKHQGQESTGKSLTTSSCSNGNGNSSTVSPTGSKLKRVRTIFTNEQLERLENEFARQQYMVGPERLYLAHALRLTEAQVKVWFQNRRIKWRKINHEKQSQRLHELKLNSPLLNSPLVNHQGGISERDDSNETAEW